MTDRQEPLTPKEEAALREYAQHHVRTDVQRLIATLDAERAARQEAADTSGLRERLYAAVDTALTTGDSVHAAIEHALSQEPTPDERPLDVERLRKAVQVVEDMSPLDYLDSGDTVDAIAAEYARLSAAGE